MKLGKINIRIKASRVALYTFILLLVSFTSLPILYTISTAFKPIDELFRFPPRFLVQNPTFNNFSDLFSALDSKTVPFTRYVANSMFAAGTTVLLTVIVSSMGAYAVAKLKPRGSALFSTIIIAALMFSGHVTLIPNYIVVNSLGLVNTLWALIIPKIAIAYNFFLMQQFMVQVPDTIIESAKIDGASNLRTFWRIVMPNLKPAWATLVVFSFVANWNDYFTPLIMITSQQLKTIPVALQNLGSTIAVAGAVSAATFIMIIPTILIYVVMQKQVMQTMMHSGIKE